MKLLIKFKNVPGNAHNIQCGIFLHIESYGLKKHRLFPLNSIAKIWTSYFNNDFIFICTRMDLLNSPDIEIL